MSKLPLIPILLGIGAFAVWKSRQAAPVSGLGDLGKGGGGGHHPHHPGGGGWRGGWGGGWAGPAWEYPDYTFVNAGPRVMDCYRDAQGNLILGIPDAKNTAAKRGKCLVDAGGNILNMLPSPLHGLGRFSIKRAASAVASSVTTPIATAITPIRAVSAPATAAITGARVLAQTGSVSASMAATKTTLRREAMTPLTVPIKALQPMMTKSMSQSVSRLGSKPGIRLALGRPKPGTNRPTPIVSSATQGPTVNDGVQWSPVPGKPGWEVAPGDDGSTVFRNQATGDAFYCTASDMASIGSPTAAVSLYLNGNAGTPGIMPGSNSGVYNTAPDTASVPGSAGSSFAPTAYGPNDPNAYNGQSYTQDPTMQQAPLQDPSATDPSTVMQQYAPATDAAAPGKAVHPLVIAGTLLAVPLAFMMTGGK